MKKQFLLSGILLASLCSFAPSQADEANKNSCATGQDLLPIKQIGMYLDGYHTYKKEVGLDTEKQKQIRTAHYCKQVNPDLFQCLIYDSNKPDAKIIGVEYVITDEAFKKLPADEQKYWHPHDGEVDSGLLSMPGLPKDKQKEILGVLHSTHGKTWQVWPDLSTSMPLGEPELMWNVDTNKISDATKKSVAARETDYAF
jgi:hypothetical protein